MVQVQKGAVKFNSIMDMAKSLAANTGEPVRRVYIRLYKRMRPDNGIPAVNPSVAFHRPARAYNRRNVATV